MPAKSSREIIPTRLRFTWNSSQGLPDASAIAKSTADRLLRDFGRPRRNPFVPFSMTPSTSQSICSCPCSRNFDQGTNRSPSGIVSIPNFVIPSCIRVNTLTDSCGNAMTSEIARLAIVMISRAVAFSPDDADVLVNVVEADPEPRQSGRIDTTRRRLLLVADCFPSAP